MIHSTQFYLFIFKTPASLPFTSAHLSLSLSDFLSLSHLSVLPPSAAALLQECEGSWESFLIGRRVECWGENGGNGLLFYWVWGACCLCGRVDVLLISLSVCLSEYGTSNRFDHPWLRLGVKMTLTLMHSRSPFLLVSPSLTNKQLILNH